MNDVELAQQLRAILSSSDGILVMPAEIYTALIQFISELEKKKHE